jgi:GDP-D-mannose dehydratase
LDGSDPRVRFTGVVADTVRRYLPGQPLVVDEGVTVKARSLNGRTWSALTEASFQVAVFGSPLRISEIMYHPPGGNAFEFIEILKDQDLQLSFTFEDWRPGDQRVFISDNTKVEKELGWKAETPPSQGIRNLMSWVRENKKLLNFLLGDSNDADRN